VLSQKRGYYLESKDFILETYDKEQADEVFGDAIERVGTIASIIRRMSFYTKTRICFTFVKLTILKK
jgi:hypothetical protein